MMNVVPFLTTLSASMVPPCRSTIVWMTGEAMARGALSVLLLSASP